VEYLEVHSTESYNELHHLLIMEELGGNLLFRDRCVHSQQLLVLSGGFV